MPREAEPVDAEPANADELAARFDTWAKGVVRNLPLYRRLCEGVAGDREVAARLLISPRPAQRIPNLLLAAVHDVVLAGDHHPDAEAIRRWYGSVTPEPWVVGRGVDDPWPHFRALALDHEVVAERIGTCSTQTNEVGRCAPLLAALAGVGAGTTGRGIGLVEIGASAGLNLLLDRYGYCYTRSRVVPGTGDALSADESDGEALWLAPNAPLVLTCALRGPCTPPLPEVMPVIDYRVGLDLHPVDPGERAQARWLVACQWPDQPERVHRSRGHERQVTRGPRRVVGSLVQRLVERDRRRVVTEDLQARRGRTALGSPAQQRVHHRQRQALPAVRRVDVDAAEADPVLGVRGHAARHLAEPDGHEVVHLLVGARWLRKAL